MRQSDQINELYAALVAAQSEMPNVFKGSTNPHFKNKYADLTSVIETCRPILAKHGLAVLQGGEAGDGASVTVTCRIIHKSGQWIESNLSMKPVKADPQGIGSCVTYARRYTLQSMLGIAADDDDGNGGSGLGAQAQRPVAPKPAQANGSDPRKVLIAEVREWTGFAPEDVGGVVRTIAKKLGITNDKFSGDELARCIEFVRTNKESKFEEVLK